MHLVDVLLGVICKIMDRHSLSGHEKSHPKAELKLIRTAPVIQTINSKKNALEYRTTLEFHQ